MYPVGWYNLPRVGVNFNTLGHLICLIKPQICKAFNYAPLIRGRYVGTF